MTVPGRHVGAERPGLVREGGVVIATHPVPNEFDDDTHPSYRPFFEDVLSQTTDPHEAESILVAGEAREQRRDICLVHWISVRGVVVDSCAFEGGYNSRNVISFSPFLFYFSSALLRMLAGVEVCLVVSSFLRTYHRTPGQIWEGRRFWGGTF